MKDCILSVLWPRRDIYSFFADHGCTKGDLTALAHYEQKQMSRSSMVDAIFEHLSTKADGGLGPFRSMLQALVKWNRFDPYYFERLRKLDRKTAERNLTHLRQLQEIRDAKVNEDRQLRAQRNAASQKPTVSREELLKLFLELHAGSLAPQERATRSRKFSAGSENSAASR